MNVIVRLLAAAVRRAPVPVVALALLATGILASFAPRLERAGLVEAYAPGSPQFGALQRIEEDLGGAGTTIQVVVTAASGDVISRAGLRAAAAIEEIVRSSPLAAYLTPSDGSDIVGFLTPLLVGLAERGIPPDLLTEDQVDEGFAIAWSAVDADTRTRLGGLFADEGTDLASSSSPAGLILIHLAFPEDLEVEESASLVQSLESALLGVGGDRVQVRVFARDLLRAFESIQREINALMRNAAVIIVAILGAVLWVSPWGGLDRRRSLRRTAADVAIAAGTTGMAVLWVMGGQVLLGPGYLGVVGRSSSITQIVPVLLIGLGVDYAIHLTARYREELGAGAAPSAAASRAAHTVGVALVLGAATTAVGFLTNLASPVPAIRDFGVLAALGISSAFLLMMTFAPSVRVLLDRRASTGGRLPAAALRRHRGGRAGRIAGSASVLAERYAAAVTVLALLLAGAGGYGLTRLDTEFELSSFVPRDAPVLEARRLLVDLFGGGRGGEAFLFVEAPAMTAELHNAQLDATDRLAGLDGVVSFGGRVAADTPASVLGSAVGSDGEVAALAELAGLAPDLRAPAGADLSALYRAASAASPEEMADVYLASGPSGGPELALRITTRSGADPARLAENLAAAAEAFRGLPGVEVVVTGEAIVETEVAAALSRSQVVSLSITLLVAGAVLVLAFWYRSGRPFLGVMTILPVCLVVLWTYGLMVVAGIPFSPSTAMVAAIAIGVGVDYAIHIVHRFLEDRTRFDSLPVALRSTLRQTGGALTGSALTTLAGFGILVTSSLQPFRQLGGVVVFALSFSLLAAIVVLPSMLVLWDRRRPASGNGVQAADRSGQDSSPSS